MKPLRTPADLLNAGLIAPEAPALEAAAPEALSVLERVAARYAVAVTPAMVGLIDPADPADPIGRQFLPQPFELDAAPEELADPIGDDAHSPVPGVVHRYADRVLLKLTHTCATYCRFCFRREVVGPGGGGELTGAALDGGAGLHRRRPGDLGGDPDRRRPAGPLRPAPWRGARRGWRPWTT